MNTVFPLPPAVLIPVAGSELFFPVRRIFCVGRNYADHAREMGAPEQADGREPPFFFSKPRDAVVTGLGEILVSYPPKTESLHHEVELVVALGSGGDHVAVNGAAELIFGYAVGLDLTRRDMQASAKAKGHPWDMSKGFDQSAVAGPIVPVENAPDMQTGRIGLAVNGALRQEGNLSAMMWSIPEIIANLSTFVRLEAGDLIYTGTPAGVGAINRKDQIVAEVHGLAELQVKLV